MRIGSACLLLTVSLLSSGCCKSAQNEGTPAGGPVVTLYENYNTGACGFTDIAAWTMPSEAYVTTVGTWFNWKQGQQSLTFTMRKDGSVFLTGELVRASCDPYQAAWCDAHMAINRSLPAGSYTLKVDEARMCQNGASGGNGFYRVRGTR